MAELLFIAPAQKKNISKPSWRGLPRVSFTRPAVADKVDPIEKHVHAAPERKTRASLAQGTIAIVLDGELKGRRAVVVGDNGSGLLTVATIEPAASAQVDQDFLIATSTKAAIEGGKVAQSKLDAVLVEYLKQPFTLHAGDRPHMMKF